MLKGKMVRVRLRRDFVEQRLWVFVGKVVEFTENWLMIEGKALLLLRRAQLEVDIDDDVRTVVIPRDSVNIIRILPDDFDLENIRTLHQGHKLCLAVKGGPAATLADMSEV